MARSKKLTNYSSEFAELVEACAVRGQVVEVQVADRRAAWRVQGKFYSWRKALNDTLLDAELRPQAYEQQQVNWLKDVASWAAKTACYFEQAMPPDLPRAVRFSSVENTELSQMLRTALAQAQPAPGTAAGSRAAEESLARIQAQVAGPDPMLLPVPDPTKKYY
jgi:hypothetical protein